jgi:hypothetical protein
MQACKETSPESTFRICNRRNYGKLMQMNSQLTRRPPAIMAVIAATAFTAAIPMASAIAWKPTYKTTEIEPRPQDSNIYA